MSNSICIFCQQDLTGNRSKEHIFPQWLLNHLCIKDDEITPTHFSYKNGEAVSTRKHSLDELLAGRICQSCNTGWMSRLEEDIKPIIIPLISADKVVVELTPKERLSLARWAAKVAYLLNYASNYHKNVPRKHYRYLYEHYDRLPEQVVVLAQQHHGNLKFYWLQQAAWNISANNDIIEEIYNRLMNESYKISLLFGKLILLIGYLPHTQLRFGLWKGIHVPLWPSKGPIGWYENKDFPWHDSIEAIAAFHTGLQAIHESSIM